METTTLYLVGSMAFSQDRSFSVLTKIFGAYWDEASAVQSASYERQGEIIVQGRPFRQETAVFKVNIPYKRTVSNLWVCYSNVFSKDGTNRCGMRVHSIHQTEDEANTALQSIPTGIQTINDVPCLVEAHMNAVTVK